MFISQLKFNKIYCKIFLILSHVISCFERQYRQLEHRNIASGQCCHFSRGNHAGLTYLEGGGFIRCGQSEGKLIIDS